MSTNAVFAGIDVSKAHLDVAVRPDEIEWRIPNTDTGAREAANKLKDLDPELVVLEATGGNVKQSVRPKRNRIIIITIQRFSIMLRFVADLTPRRFDVEDVVRVI